MDLLEIDRREGFRDVSVAGTGRVGRAFGSRQNREPVYGLAGEISGEALRRGRIRERRARADDLKLLGSERQPVPQAPDQHGHLGPLRTPVEVSLVQDEDQTFTWVSRVVLLGRLEDASFNRPQKHVLEHRVVGDKEVGNPLLCLVPQEEFRVLGTLDRPDPLAIALPWTLA